MTVPDVNILLYAYDTASPKYKAARAWLEETFSSGELIGLPWQNIVAFIRIITNTKLPGERPTPERVMHVVDQWLKLPNIRLLAPGENHWPLLRQTILEGEVRGPRITDAELAALTIEHGGTLYTADRDFARFPGLRWTNPLQANE
jgi:toxin-antitoxin system PIN domain toxin